MQKQKAKKRRAEPAATENKTATLLRERTDRRTERRFTPKAQPLALLSILLTSGGALLAGAGVFAQFLRGAGPHPYGVYLLVGGLLGLGLGILLGGRAVYAARVGDAGLALERADGTFERLGWFEVDAIRFAEGTLSFSGAGKLVSLPVETHPDAAAFALSEARARIPGRAESVTEKLTLAPGAGSEVVLEPPQLAGLRCAATDRLISFEADARLCGRCGQAYHREGVPKHCKSCDARLL
ncbi:MAG TPA: hypothetical protein VL400_26595 [Polyangiaceae bacterium]|jgi:hypothetical protein|nr:hypothetical protein [Polyangiaceae bacterium]